MRIEKPTQKLIERMKPQIKIMYSEEGLSKSEISRRLKLNRKILSKMITSWDIPFNVNGIVYPAKSTVKFIGENKENIIFMFDNDFSVSEIARRLNVDRKVINTTCLQHDPDIYEAYAAAKLRAKKRTEDRIRKMVTKSAYNYDFEEIDGEKWIEIDEFPGYEVSNMGRVRHYSKRYKLFHLVALNYTGINKRRVYVSLYNNRYRRNAILSRLVATYFVDGKIHEDDEVNHIDGNPMNNVYTNLEWVTPDDNKRHYANIIRNGINYDMVRSITFMGKTFYSIDTFAEFVGYSKESIRNFITTGKIYSLFNGIQIVY